MANLFKQYIAAVCALGSLLSLSACSGVGLLNFTIPRDGYTVHKDIAYGTDARQKLDIYVPANLTKPAPVIVFFYGGSWQFGSKNDYLFVGQAFASKGYVTVIADYRLYPQVYFPAFMDDAAHAFDWVHTNISQYNGDADNLFLAGHSAGGYMAVMLASNTQYIRQAGGNPAWIRGVIGIAGPYDFLPFTDPKIIALFSKSADPDTQPVTFMHPHMPPMLLVHGSCDTTVLPRNTYHAEAKLRALGDPVSVIIYPDVAHIGIVLSLARGFRYKTALLEDVDVFIRMNVKPSP